MSDQKNEQYDPTANGTEPTIVTTQEQATEAMQPVDIPASFEPIPPSIPPKNQFDDHIPSKKSRSKWMIPTIATVCIIAVIIAIIIGWYTIDARKKLDAARADCTTSMKLAAEAKNAWTHLLSKETTVAASKITDKQVADAAVVDQLKNAMTGSRINDSIDCSTVTDTQSLQQAAEQNRKIAEAYEKQTTTLSTVVKTVIDSQQKKTLLDTQTMLNSKLNEARTLLANSDGKVQDTKTRNTLSDAINNADKNKTSTSIDQLNKLTNTLTTAIQTVNDSMTAKQKADEEARKQAAAAQTTPSTPLQNYSNNGYQSYTPTYGESQGTNTYNNPNNGNNSGLSSSPSSGSSDSYTTDNSAGQHQFWQDLNDGKTCSFGSTTGDSNFNDNPLTCQ